jgi:hypothetical protein
VSVTLKLHDMDAKFIGDLLEDAAKMEFPGSDTQDSDARHYRRVQQTIKSATPKRLEELAGAFKAAVRANQK